MDLAIVTNAWYPAGVPEYVHMTDELKSRYCRRWNIDYLRTAENPHPENPPAWAKPSIMLRALEDHAWAVWMDCDAAPVGMEFDIQGFLLGMPQLVVMARDINGWNSGVFAIPWTDRCMDWLGLVESMHGDARYQSGWWDQQAMSDTFDSGHAGIVVQPDPSIGFNSYPDIYNRKGDPNLYRDGHWCMHVPGADDKTRANAFRRFFNVMISII